MDVRAMILIGGQEGPPRAMPERIAGRPLALLDVLGKPVLHHVVERLRRHGIRQITVISDVAEEAPRAERDAKRPDLPWLNAEEDSFWRQAESTFADFAHAGAELVLVIRLGAYAEVDYENLLQFHLEQRARVTQVVTSGGAIETFVISSSRRNDMAFLLRNRLKKVRSACTEYHFEGYCNRLENAADLRRLAHDGLMRRAELEPAGQQVKPGVWVADRARIERGTRLVAPVFIGHRARIRAGVLLTRGSAVEHHAEVDCGTVVENATILPYAYVGPGLDVTHAVAGFMQLQHLRRNVTVEISDPKLIGEVPHNVSVRVLKKAAGLAAFLPAIFVRGVKTKGAAKKETDLPLSAAPACAADMTGQFGTAVQPTKAGTFAADFAVVRRYGNQ